MTKPERIMSRATDRRDFLKQAAAIAALAARGTSRAEPEDKVFPIIDTHQHLWDLKKFRLPWVKNAEKLNRSFTTDDYAQATGELARAAKPGSPPARVVKSVYMEVDVAPEQQQAEAEYVIDICKQGKTPMAAAVISGRPASEGFAAY